MTNSERRWFYCGHAALGGWFGLFVVWAGNGIAGHSTIGSIPYTPFAAGVVVVLFACVGLAWAAFKRRRPAIEA